MNESDNRGEVGLTRSKLELYAPKREKEHVEIEREYGNYHQLQAHPINSRRAQIQAVFPVNFL